MLSRLLGGAPPRERGLWIGVRHRGEVVSHKLYQLVTPAESSAALPGVDASLRRALVPILVGVDPADGSAELYHRLLTPNRVKVHRVLASAGAATAFPAIEDCVADLRGRPGGAAWNDLRVGASFRVGPGASPVVTLFAHGAGLFPNDHVARERLLALGERLGADMRAYRDLSVHLDLHAKPPVHGIVGLTPEPGGTVRLSVNVAPVVGRRRVRTPTNA